MKTIKLIILLALLMPVVLNAETVTVDGIDYYITSDWYYGTQTARVSARAGKNGYSAYKELDNIVIHEQVETLGVLRAIDLNVFTITLLEDVSIGLDIIRPDEIVHLAIEFNAEGGVIGNGDRDGRAEFSAG